MRTLGKSLYLSCDKISKKYFFFHFYQHILNKIDFYIPFNENFSLYHLFVSGSYVLVSSYNGIIKNEDYLFLHFYPSLLDRDVCGPFKFNSNFSIFALENSTWKSLLDFVSSLLVSFSGHITNCYNTFKILSFNLITVWDVYDHMGKGRNTF